MDNETIVTLVKNNFPEAITGSEIFRNELTIIVKKEYITEIAGFMKENKELIEKTRMKVKKIVKDHDARTPADVDYIKNKVRNDVGQFLFSQTKRRPMVLPVVIKV